MSQGEHRLNNSEMSAHDPHPCEQGQRRQHAPIDIFDLIVVVKELKQSRKQKGGPSTGTHVQRLVKIHQTKTGGACQARSGEV